VNILQPGCGVGGHCIAVDPWFIVHAGGENANLIRTAREKNDYKSDWVVEKVKNSALEFEMKHLRKPVIACMGLAFKPNIDDLRESPALKITKELLTQDLSIVAVEPNVKEVDGVNVVTLDSLEADILVFLVGHSEFKDYESTSVVLDFCGVTKK
jgi:UDP-N-acetyl-D-mannosaminuronic acid dehydrogenase